jgi:hypothetical protein
MTPLLLDTSLAALPPIPPEVGEGRQAIMLARFNAQYPGSPHRTSTVDLWAVECRSCGGRLNAFVRYDEFHPEPAPELCRECRSRRGRSYGRRPPDVDTAREWVERVKRKYYEALRAAPYDAAAYNIAYVRAELYDSIDLLSARMREAAGDRARAAYARVVSARALRVRAVNAINRAVGAASKRDKHVAEMLS